MRIFGSILALAVAAAGGAAAASEEARPETPPTEVGVLSMKRARFSRLRVDAPAQSPGLKPGVDSI